MAESGQYLVAGVHALFVINDAGVVDAGMWYEVQYARWDAQTRQIVVVWVDPERPLLVLVTAEENPASFMKILTGHVNNAIVISRQATGKGGAVVTATVRRRIDGKLFSSVIVQGNLLDEDRDLAGQLEADVRSEVGLEA